MSISRLRILLILLFILTATFLLWGVARIPFHPDESTQLFMSADVEKIFTNPTALFWEPGQPLDQTRTYCLLDAPLARYAFGLSRILTGQAPLPSDWNWSATWAENLANGALPSESLLHVGRLASTILLIASVVFIYLAGKQLGGLTTGVLAAALLATNALVLLHARRAMAEGAMIFGITLLLWLVLRQKTRPGWVGLASALAFNAKQSTLAIFPVALLFLLIPDGKLPKPIQKVKLFSPIISVLVFCVVTYALNPFLWEHPIAGAQAAVHARLDFVSGQVQTLEDLAPDQILRTPGQRLAVLIAQVYITPPAIADVGNYLESTAAAEADYLSMPGNQLFRGAAWGMIFLTLTLFGMIAGFFEWYRSRKMPEPHTRPIILLLATLIQWTALVYTVPIPYQRYAMPLIPFTVLWIAYAMKKIADLVSSTLTKRAETTVSAPEK